MKRFVNLDEATKALQKFTGVTSNLHEDSTSKETTYQGSWSDPRFALMDFSIGAVWQLDEHLVPICPFVEAQNPDYLKYMGFDSSEPTYITLGKLNFKERDQWQDKKPMFDLLPIDNCIAATHFFIMMQKAVVNGARKGNSGWQVFPLTNANGEKSDNSTHSLLAWQATSAVYDNRYWQFYLLPIGYCKPPIIDGKYHSNFLADWRDKVLTNSIFEVITYNRPNFEQLHEDYLQEQETVRCNQRDAMDEENQAAYAELRKICADLNHRINALRERPICSDLVPLVIYGDKLKFDCDDGKEYSVATVTAFIDDRADRLIDYDDSIKKIDAEFKERIEGTLRGSINTTQLEYFEVVLPKPIYTPNEATSIIRRFPYNAYGLSALKEWIDTYQLHAANHPDNIMTD